jgi:putative tryptophan/tyrosine transport system substrate-binding protein
MRRRAFIVVLGAAAAWPFVICAQQAAMPVVGFLNSASPAPFAHLVSAFRQGLSEAGYVEGRSVAIEYRWAEGWYERLTTLADDLVRRRVAVIAASGGTPAVLAAKAGTGTIPIVFIGSGDVVQMGFVASFNRPGGNVTGVSVYTAALNAKRLSLLRELVPAASRVAALLNPANRNAEAQWRDIQEAARALGQEVEAMHASSDGDIEAAFTAASHARVGAMLVAADAFFFGRCD